MSHCFYWKPVILDSLLYQLWVLFLPSRTCYFLICLLSDWLDYFSEAHFLSQKEDSDADSQRVQPWMCSQPPSDDKGFMGFPLTASSHSLLADCSVVLSSALGHKLLLGLFNHI